MAHAYRFFTPETVLTFRAAAACIVPPDGESPGADAEEAIRIADRVLAARPERDRRLLSTFLTVVEWLPVLRYARRFSNLDPEKRERFLRSLERSSISKFRQGFFGLKTFSLMGYYALDATFRDLGYPGPRMDAPYYQLRQRDG